MDDYRQVRYSLADMLAWRGIECGDECVRCGGSGLYTYSTTATWRGGVGGSTPTTNICDHCWGSGDKHRPFRHPRMAA